MYRAYCWLNVVWYAVILVLGVFSVRLAKANAADLGEQASILISSGYLLMALGIVFGAFALWFLTVPLKKTPHIAHMVNICLGISTCCLAPFCIYLALQWQKPEVLEFFQRQDFDLK